MSDNSFGPMTVQLDGRDVVVDTAIPVERVPDDALLIMQSGGKYSDRLDMLAALPIDKLPLPPEFPVYLRSGTGSYLMPMERALRRGTWTIALDEDQLNALKKT